MTNFVTTQPSPQTPFLNVPLALGERLNHAMRILQSGGRRTAGEGQTLRTGVNLMPMGWVGDSSRLPESLREKMLKEV